MYTTKSFNMNSKESLKYQVIKKYLDGKIFRKEAARLLSVSERTVIRYSQKIKEFGVFGVKHGNYGKTSNSIKYPIELRERVLEIYVSKYYDFNLKHFSEILEKEYEIKIHYSTLWTWFKAQKLIKSPRRKRPRKHVYRTRMPQEGLLLQMDGSHHKFNGKDDWCLIACIDDATSDIPYAEFFDNGETTLGCMKVLEQIIKKKGVPKAIYTDRAGWAGGGKRTEFSQFKRACEKLGIQVLFADSPEAKGRIERSFKTIQDRLIPELRLKGIKDLKKANQYLRKEFLGKYWKSKNTIKAQDPEIAYSPLDPWLRLNEILCIEEDRKIGSDQTVSWKSEKFIIDGGPISYAGYQAIFRTDLKGKTRVFVQEKEVEMRPIPKVLNIESQEPKKAKIELDPLLYIKMYRKIIELNNAVKVHRISGKPLKLKRKAS